MTDREIRIAKFQSWLLRLRIRAQIRKGTPTRVPWGKR